MLPTIKQKKALERLVYIHTHRHVPEYVMFILSWAGKDLTKTQDPAVNISPEKQQPSYFILFCINITVVCVKKWKQLYLLPPSCQSDKFTHFFG